MTIRNMIKANQRPDTAADIAWRKDSRAANEQVVRELNERFPVLSDKNMRDAIEFREQRYKEIMKAKGYAS